MLRRPAFSLRSSRWLRWRGMDNLELIIDLHLRNDRQGPGCDEETRRAIDLARLGSAKGLRVADVGCGTGASTLQLARSLDCTIEAFDAAPAFVERLRARAEQVGLADRVAARVGQMESPPLGDGELDLIWSEGAIYNMGFGDGVRAWRRLLRPGGVLAVSELSWKTEQRPAEVEAHWTREYPGISTPSANIRTLEQAGYEPMGFFFLPDRCWTANYYEPLRAGFRAFLERHGHSDAAEEVVAGEEHEMRMFEAFGRWYGYAFYISRRSG